MMENVEIEIEIGILYGEADETKAHLVRHIKGRQPAWSSAKIATSMSNRITVIALQQSAL